MLHPTASKIVLNAMLKSQYSSQILSSTPHTRLACTSSAGLRCTENLSVVAESRKAAPSAAIPASTLDEEFELVKNAFFTLPEDQSGWLYHRWLLSNAMAAAQAARGGSEVCSTMLH